MLHQECIISERESLYYCVVALVQGHDLYNHILVPEHNLQQHNVPLLVALWLPTGMNMIIKVMTLNKSYYTVV